MSHQKTTLVVSKKRKKLCERFATSSFSTTYSSVYVKFANDPITKENLCVFATQSSTGFYYFDNYVENKEKAEKLLTVAGAGHLRNYVLIFNLSSLTSQEVVHLQCLYSFLQSEKNNILKCLVTTDLEAVDYIASISCAFQDEGKKEDAQYLINYSFAVDEEDFAKNTMCNALTNAIANKNPSTSSTVGTDLMESFGSWGGLGTRVRNAEDIKQVSPLSALDAQIAYDLLFEKYEKEFL